MHDTLFVEIEDVGSDDHALPGFALRNPDMYVAGTRVNLVSSGPPPREIGAGDTFAPGATLSHENLSCLPLEVM